MKAMVLKKFCNPLELVDIHMPVITDYYKLEEVNTALDDLRNNKILGRAIIEIV